MSATSVLAGIIQGEARDPADQYGVASVIYNRTAAGFPGSQNGAIGVATAPRQFSAYPNGLQSPTPYATQLAQNLVNGQPPGDAPTGNALYYNGPGGAQYNVYGGTGSYGQGTNAYSDRFNQPPSQDFQLPGGSGSSSPPPVINTTTQAQDAPLLDMSGFGIQQIQGVDAGGNPILGSPTDATSTSTPIIDSSGNQIGAEATIPPDLSGISNFGAVDVTAGSPFGGAFDSTGNVVAGSSGGIGGLGLPSGLFSGGTGGGGLGYQVQPANISSSQEAVTGTPQPVPDVANAINNVGIGLNKTVGAAGSAISEGIGGAFSQAVTSAENYAGSFFARGGVMVLAVILALIGGFLLMPRGARQSILPAGT